MFEALLWGCIKCPIAGWILLALINQRRDTPPPVSGAYVDTLFNLTVDGGRSLDDDELVTLCSEFINAGTDSTTTSLQWLMANLVIHQDIQVRLYDEIVSVTGRGKPVEEDDLWQMPYLEVVVKETLRRHPQEHFVLAHAVTRPCELASYEVPADTSVNFYVAGIGMDPRVWKNPSEFNHEHFVDEGMEVDLTGTKEIKMMPFGAGRRVCPGLGMAMFHLNLIVARLVEEFAWECKPGKAVDLSEMQDFTTVMKWVVYRTCILTRICGSPENICCTSTAVDHHFIRNLVAGHKYTPPYIFPL